jgi:uncharacterized membrane protein
MTTTTKTRPSFMTHKALLRAIDSERIEEAIRQAERRTSGEIRVSVSRFFWGDVERVAERAFDRLGMRNTRERNGVLFFLVPARRRFAVVGDEGIHAKVGQDFWERVAAAVSEHLRAGDFTLGLVHGVETVGEQLALHFPFDPASDTNELANEVDFGGKPPKR